MGACLGRDTHDARADMANHLRNMVSKNKKRYVDGAYNLDLSYIERDVVAMGYPGEKLEGIYRNNIDDVAKFLDEKHKDRYRIYNLCSERSYNADKFHNRVAVYPFDDHNPPKIATIQAFCEDVHGWLARHEGNVAVVHCKAGKGRTGTMICCYLLYSGRCGNAAEALDKYGLKRTSDSKGVTIPSQRRYVEYFASLLEMGGGPKQNCVKNYSPPELTLRSFAMEPLPMSNGGLGTFDVRVFQENQKIDISILNIVKNNKSIEMQLDCKPVLGDVKVEIYHTKSKIKINQVKIFHFWFNTFFVVHEVHSTRGGCSDNMYRLSFDKWQLDNPHKDTQNKLYPQDFKVQLLVDRYVQKSEGWDSQAATPVSTNCSNNQPSPNSSGPETDESMEPEEGWDSGESEYL